MTPLVARGGELERDHPYGVVRQLLEPGLAALTGAERAEALSGAAELARPLLGGAGAAPREEHAAHYGLYWTCANLSARRPLALIVDDAHWSDLASLRFLHFLARRVNELALLIVLTVRSGEPGEHRAVLERLAAEVGATVIRPAPLSIEAVREVVATELSEPDDAFTAACRDATGGNPFLLSELMRTLAERGVEPSASEIGRIEHAGPEAVARSVLVRLERLGPEAAALAAATAILEDGAELHHAAAVANLPTSAADGAADALSAAGLLADARPLRFVHPLVRSAITDSLGAGAAAEAHRRAARVLTRAAAPPENVAAHLLAADPGIGPEAVATLRAAAERSVERGAPEVAVLHYERALREDLSRAERAELLLELGRADIDARPLQAKAHLLEAYELASDPMVRAHAARKLALSEPGYGTDSLRRLDDAVAALDGPTRASTGAAERTELIGRLRAERLAITVSAPALDPEEARLLDALEPPASVRATADGLVLVSLARYRLMRGRPAVEVVPLVERALASRTVRDELGRERLWLVNSIVILLHGDRLEQASQVLEEVVVAARAGGSAALFALACAFRAVVAMQNGAVEEAEAEARAALAAEGVDRWQQGPPLGALIEALLEQGRTEEAEQELELAGLTDELPDLRPYTPLLIARGRLHAAAGRAEGALADLFEAERRLDRSGGGHPVGLDGRAHASLTLLGLGRRGEARRRAGEDLERARRWGTPRVVGRALRVHALTREGSATLTELEEAIACLERSPARLELARALADYGGALRRANRRADARAPLRRALALAEECRAVALAEQAREELTVTGARVPRTDRQGQESLTPSEKRICQMAAAGLSNPAIAQALFVTVKTVEMHLGHAYRKLDIRSRTELPRALTE